MRRPLRTLVSLLSVVAIASAAAPVKGDDAAGHEFFEKRIRPLLVTHCQKCHGPEKQENSLRVDSLAALVKGGDYGPAVVPGKPEQSLLVAAVQHGEIVQMPPKTKLKGEQIDDLTQWVKMGAPWPDAKPVTPVTSQPDRAKISAEDRSFWAFRSRLSASPPAVVDAAWVRSAIDRFILAGLEANGLQPAPPADKRTLIRRATFDLLGLPPTPLEVAAFVADDSPDAFARVVERLLASPHYGERWGRHWLDVARYADSNGMDENVAHANAWRYRDYVIDSLNRDKPYEQFVREQIAGDLMGDPADHALTAERLTATGFLVIGPKMLAEDDPQKMELDIVDEQLDTVGRTFLGMTLGCARCHDHKFDPVPTADYYSLAAIFKSTKTMANHKVVAMWHERTIAAPEQVAERDRLQQIAQASRQQLDVRAKEAGEAFLQAERAKAAQYLAAAMEVQRQKGLELKPQMTAAALPAGAIVVEAEKYDRGNVVRDFTTYGDKIGVIYNAGPLPNLAEYDVEVGKAGSYQIELRLAAAESRPVQLSVDGKLVNAQAGGKVTGSWQPDTQTWSAAAIVKLDAGKHVVQLKRDGPFPHFDKLALVPHELPAGSESLLPRTLEQIAAEQSLNVALLQQWLAYVEKSGAPVEEKLAEVVNDKNGPFALPQDAEQNYAATTQAELKQLREAATTAEKTVPILPMVMCASEGAIGNLKVHLRGNYLTLGQEVPRQFLQVVAGEQQTPVSADRSGRLELASWMTAADHPLTSRVMVNRVWHWHFGNGLVRSPDNFGRLGELPDNQPLLDYLAVELIRQGWSLKALHRLIMLSSTYQMSAAYNPAAAGIDPENRLHWRTDRRRLEAEALRDAVLAVSGELDANTGGSLLGVANHAYVASTASERYEPYYVARRSVYLPVIRSNVYDLFQAFDFADPSSPNGQRNSTTIAPQALALMNSRLVEEQSRRWAERLLLLDDDAARVQTAYLQAYSRPASQQELSRALAFARRIEQSLTQQQQAEPRLRAWQSLCRVLLGSSEFVYVE